jgi:hypothetical protein
MNTRSPRYSPTLERGGDIPVAAMQTKRQIVQSCLGRADPVEYDWRFVIVLSVMPVMELGKL